eukprot:TRINITY_DN122438_c0_g1_i1.p1 TRINITY_DN122438_c0_g1~~TRINITY_DN122438_c0_g1_i1.p1  ORF type:complete len:391 (-),score=88.25 TRINITY_DN122438_c0_g1_i1:343-1515(-)
MSTHKCFERHRELAQRHEDKAHAWLQDPAILTHTGDGEGIGAALAAAVAAGDTGSASPAAKALLKAVRSAVAQQRLAVREYKEAARLRPRDVTTKQQLAKANKALKGLQASMEKPRPWGLRRFLAHYNLSIRYWDLGQARAAITEAERACEELRRAGLPLGCAEQNRELMERVQAQFAGEQQRLIEAAKRSPQGISVNYKLAMLLFDKRMLFRAEALLKWTRECARATSALRLVEQDRQQLQMESEQSPAAAIAAAMSPATLRGKKARQQICHLVEDIEDDLEFLAELREQWCVEEEAGKAEELQETGIRDGARPQLLHCLQRRWSEEPAACEACNRWWADICTRGDLSVPPARSERASSPLHTKASPMQQPYAVRKRPQSSGAVRKCCW